MKSGVIFSSNTPEYLEFLYYIFQHFKCPLHGCQIHLYTILNERKRSQAPFTTLTLYPLQQSAHATSRIKTYSLDSLILQKSSPLIPDPPLLLLNEDNGS